MDWSQIKDADLSFENIGSWPALAKGIFIGFMCAVMALVFFYTQIKDERLQLSNLQAKEVELRATFEAKAGLAGNLPTYRDQVKQMQQTFAKLLRQLPEQHEIPGLLDELSFIGIDNGLEFKKMNWQPEVEQEFSIELPIAIEVVGDYHQLGAFVSGVSALPRIVILDNIEMKRLENGDRLSMSMLAKTYRYKAKEAKEQQQ